ncbi:MAG: DUF349 domain-containing protein [Corynebacterium sp.]|uniref:DUF349 domain-containing protein n=1 Tax=Corynebacterium sp. TaxID=1720 RepID=UPI003F96CA67
MNVPKPGPRPGSPAVSRPVHAPAAQTPDYSDPSVVAEYGRIDEDGTVWLATPGGPGTERRIGEWKAGTPEEGLVHFGRRYTDLATEVELLAARLDSHPEEVGRIRGDAVRLRDGLDSAGVLGDIDALHRRLSGILDRTGDVEARGMDRRGELVADAERIAESGSDWKADGDRLRAIVDEWKTIGGGDRATNDALWKRIRTAREEFNRRRGSHFADLDKQRGAVKRHKEDIISRAEAIQDSTDWNETARAYRDLMAEWKGAGRAHRAEDDRLWARFRAAQDHFFGARDEDNRRRDAEFEVNAEAKQKLLDEYDGRIDPATDLDRARELLRELQGKWDELGFVPRARVREFDEKIGALESRVSDFAEEQWRRTDPEAEARVAQFRAKVDQLRTAAQDAEDSGRQKKAAELREQAEQWAQWAETAAEAAQG